LIHRRSTGYRSGIPNGRNSTPESEEENMKKEGLVLVVISSLLVLTLLSGTGLAQGQPKTSAAGPATAGMETIKGTIDFNERLGGYFIRGEEPGGEFFVTNQNVKVLKKLRQSGKTVTIEGRASEKGAEYFTIEKIDGKKYSAAKAAAKKPASK
jgi:hypothetical protein